MTVCLFQPYFSSISAGESPARYSRAAIRRLIAFGIRLVRELLADSLNCEPRDLSPYSVMLDYLSWKLSKFLTTSIKTSRVFLLSYVR